MFHLVSYFAGLLKREFTRQNMEILEGNMSFEFTIWSIATEGKASEAQGRCLLVLTTELQQTYLSFHALQFA